MSAITGIFMRNGKEVDPQLMKKMNDKLSHRGPDGSAIWCNGPVGLGHQMLWTTPESLHEVLPLEENGLVITADARIDNRAELSEHLGIRDEEDVSDSYYILKAYTKWGEECPDKLLGDFAFAIWDKNEEKLFCARDHMGVKPFYYYLDEDMFVFGTEIKALFEVEGVPKEINDLKIAFYLKKIRTDKNLTFYDSIFCLASAHYIILNKNYLRIKQYWELDPKLKIKMESEEDYKQAFLKIFAEAVHCRLRSTFPLGFELSGGLDSSSVVRMARNLLDNEFKKKNNGQKQIETFSMIFNDFPEINEHYYINIVNNASGISPNLIKSDNISPLKNIKSILWYQEQPFYTPNMSILCNMYKKMTDKKIHVVLSGEGGDQTISRGKKYFSELTMTFKWIKLAREIIGQSKNTGVNILAIFLGNAIFPLIPSSMKIITKKILLNLNFIETEQKDISILNENFNKSLEEVDYFRNNEIIQNKSINKAKENHYFEISVLSPQTNLEMINKLASSFKIEPRYPFYDKRLVEFCYSIPTEIKFKNGWDRYIQRISLENILPEEIRWRPLKKFFHSLYIKNLLLFENKYLDEIFVDENHVIDYYVNINLTKILYKKYKNGNKNIVIVRYLWLVTILNSWLKEIKK